MNDTTPPPIPQPPTPPKSKSDLSLPGLILLLSGVALAIGLGAAVLLIGVGRIRELSRSISHPKTETDLRKAVADYQNEVRKDFRETGAISPDSNRTERLIQRIESSSQKLGGSEKAMTDAAANLLKKIQVHEKAYYDAFHKLSVQTIIRPVGITNIAQLDDHRQSVTNFMSANRKLKDAIAHGDTLFEAELVKSGVPRTSIDAALSGYRQSSGPRNKLIAEIRAQDAALGTNLFTLLDLYQAQWGRWRCAEDDRAAVFQDKTFAQDYAATLHSIVSLGKEQAAAQQKLLALKPPNPKP